MSLWEASKKRLVSIVFSDGSYRKTAAYFLALGFTNGKKTSCPIFQTRPKQSFPVNRQGSCIRSPSAGKKERPKPAFYSRLWSLSSSSWNNFKNFLVREDSPIFDCSR